MSNELLDIFIIGGGVNGTGIARDAAGRGLSVMLVEKDDLASGTSSASTKLIHGGLRYLENYDFMLVRHALIEREVLLRSAPHIIWPLRFILPHHKELRSAFILRAGLLIYDNLGGRKELPATKTRNLRTHKTGKPLDPKLRKGFEYSDCWVNDARLVVLNALDAHERGAVIKTRTEFVSAKRAQGVWEIVYKDELGEQVVRARAMINAAGPWLSLTDDEIKDSKPATIPVRLIKGSHIIVNQVYEGKHAYIFQHPDGRIVFTIPYEGKFTLIGTTEAELEGRIEDAKISEKEIEYLCDLASKYFVTKISPDDVVHTYSGVRGLKDEDEDASEVSRDYELNLDNVDDQAPLLSVVGGKITTFRRLAEDAMEILCPILGNEMSNWTEDAFLPGGDLGGMTIKKFLKTKHKRYPWFSKEEMLRLCQAYGSRIDEVLRKAKSKQELGRDFGAGFSEAELQYLIKTEWATQAEDVLWRRSKLLLHLDASQQQAVADYLEKY
ncbi:MAG: glycerol-3-phosphate dehydrogenase [Gammaproteobacteria bacterium]|nr:glycerol-3-phosphate dehydrogenase [Gammaproteobacteria bacterium]NNC97566.1 glycerol-3-phosphate dehydrogenase [Gammaproteobacteria bacterium]NNM14979.1 glycerol-3-phosphate dehydrogenase [Gammaproteobacteria bacterium]